MLKLKIKEEEGVKDEPRCLARVARWQLKEGTNRKEGMYLGSDFFQSEVLDETELKVDPKISKISGFISPKE